MTDTPTTPDPDAPYVAAVVTGRDDAAVHPGNPNGTTYGAAVTMPTMAAAVTAALDMRATVDVHAGGGRGRRVARVHVDRGIDYGPAVPPTPGV